MSLGLGFAKVVVREKGYSVSVLSVPDVFRRFTDVDTRPHSTDIPGRVPSPGPSSNIVSRLLDVDVGTCISSFIKSL